MANTQYPNSNGLISSEYKNPVDAMSFKIFNLFDIYRVNSGLSIDESIPTVLLFVSLYKDGIVSPETMNRDFNFSGLHQRILESNINEDLEDAYLTVINELDDSLSKIFYHSLDYLCFHLFQIERNLLIEYFPAIIDDVIYRIAKAQGRYTTEFNQPIELTCFINSLVELKSDAKIFNPFAGLASYGINISDYQTYIGQEINQRTWIVGFLRLMAYARLSNANYEIADSIKGWPEDSNFDLIVSTPPFGMRLNRYDLPYEFGQIRSVEEFLITKGLNSLSRKGQMIVVVPRGFLSSGLKSSLEVRKNLIRRDALEMVISLPTGIFSSTGIATAVLVISKNKTISGVVKFVNAEDCFTLQNSNKQLDSQFILSQITTGNDSNIVKTTQLLEIKDNDYNLNPNIYFKKEIVAPKGFEMRELKDILSNIKRITNHNDSIGRYIQISDLANDVFDYERSYTDTNVSTLKKNVVQLNKSALLVSKVSLNLKPTHFIKSTDEPIYLSLNIEAFEIKDKSVLMPYLIHELYDDYFQEQLNSFALGSSIASVSTKNLLSCKIRVPSLKKQDEIVDESRKQLILTKEKELKQLREKFEQQTYEEFASLKHALGKPIPGIATAIEYIYEYLQKNEGSPITLNDIVSNRRKTTLQDKFNVVNNGLKLIQTLLQKGDNGLVIENYPLQSYKIVGYIKDYCKSYSSDKFIINIYDTNDECNDIEISANKDLITILLNDVLSNANNHAFADFDLERNKVDIFIFVIENHLNLIIANNGTPFPENFDQSKFVQKYQKAGDNSGAGLGGYDINRITQYFNGTFNLITKPMDGYNTIYQFIFTVLDLKEEINE